MNIHAHWRFLAAASMMAAGLTGCGGGDGTAPPTVVTPDTIDFQIFVNRAFFNPADSIPVSLNLTFNFDANDDPTAFDMLLASGSFGGG
jgi:hypothetical protein